MTDHRKPAADTKAADARAERIADWKRRIRDHRTAIKIGVERGNVAAIKQHAHRILVLCDKWQDEIA
jgi:hypothetical protein